MKDTTVKPSSEARRMLLRLRNYITSRCLVLCWGTYILGLIWLFLHPAVTLTTGELKCRGTYTSENALLIDLVEARINDQEAHLAHKFHQKLLELPELKSRGCQDNCSAVVDWIDTQLRGVDRVEAYRQVVQIDGISTPRTNVYGILRASPLADGKEAIVLVTHYRNVGATSDDYSGLSMGLALLKYLARVKWLAKDVILLAADDGALDGSDGYAPGTEAWLQAYHLDRVQTSGLQDGLPMRAGIIRAAVNLETMFDSRQVGAVGIYAAGMNGQLPNLDLVNTAVRAFRKHKIPTILDRADVQQISEHKPESYISSVITLITSLSEKYVPEELKQGTLNYLTNLKGMLNFMTTLASGPSGPHANFISYNIDSITLSLTTKLSSGDRRLSTREVLRSLEMVVRALSNLEEKLHQSFYLYVLPSTTTFVSVGEYFYAVALTISPAIVHLLYLANHTTGMRVAFALAVLFTIETLCVLLLVVFCHYFATPTALLQPFSPSDVSVTRWLALAIAISVVQALVIVIIMPALRSVTGFSGCVEMYAWRTQVMTYEAEQQKSLSHESKSIAVEAKREFRNDIPNLDSGWCAIKFITMAVLVYSHCILGILNYPMALFGAIPMIHFVSVIPFTTATLASNAWSGFWLFLSSPLVLVVLLNWSRLDVIAGLSYAVDSFVQRTNLLALPYVCCIYTSVHTLSLAIWLYPAPRDISTSERKVKQE
ncbi:unnamed protein product [Peronospora destructor]|uniref:Transmembrane protein n=1 Tax=Peronospora destructor TaxID=86335 RepID=A0AAV0V6V3_9STRA|nr:unnamed protein product [Peronospora destructor]